MSKNYGLELYKLIINPENDPDIIYADEHGWVDDETFCVWVHLVWFADFIKALTDIFGYSLFDDGGIEARIGSNYVCVDLGKIASDYGIDLESIFPKEKNRH